MKRRADLGYALAGVLSLLYLLNLTGGFVEILPDNLPFIGNIDEAGMALLFWKALQHFLWRWRKPRGLQ